MTVHGPSAADRMHFDEGLQREIAEIYCNRGDRFADHRDNYVYVASRPDNKRRLPGNHTIRRDEYDQEFAMLAKHLPS